jgi:hypothetical protein
MTPEAQRIAIAEACGHINIRKNSTGGIYAQGSMGCSTCGIPDYLNDLNSMHGAEKRLPHETVYTYMMSLSKVMRNPISDKGKLHTYLFHATAAQRAEAFLKTLNLWKS